MQRAPPHSDSHTDATHTWLSSDEVAARLKIPKKTLGVIIERGRYDTPGTAEHYKHQIELGSPKAHM